MVLDSVTSAHSRRNYGKALDLLFAFAASRPLTRALLLEYRTSMEDLAPQQFQIITESDIPSKATALDLGSRARSSPTLAN
jgi:hypothetical protein